MVYDPYDGSNLRNRVSDSCEIPRPDQAWYDWLEERNRIERKKERSRNKPLTSKERLPLTVSGVGSSRFTEIATEVPAFKGLGVASQQLLGSNSSREGQQRKYTEISHDLIEQLAEKIMSRGKAVSSLTAENAGLGYSSMPPFQTREPTASECGFTDESWD